MAPPSVDEDLERRIRERAHSIWMEEGCPEGREKEHWEKARELIAQEDNPAATTEKPPRNAYAGGTQPVEPLDAVENQGEFPVLTDQGEEQMAPKRRAPRKRTPKS